MGKCFFPRSHLPGLPPHQWLVQGEICSLRVSLWPEKQVRATSVATCLLKTLRSLGQLTIVG